MCLRNNPRLGVTNGTRGTLTHLDPDGAATLTTRHGEHRQLPATYLHDGHLAHGYATTIQKAQGATVDHALVLGTEELGQQSGYTALTRGRRSNEFYIFSPEERRRRLDPELLAALDHDQTKSLARGPDRGRADGAGW